MRFYLLAFLGAALLVNKSLGQLNDPVTDAPSPTTTTDPEASTTTTVSTPQVPMPIYHATTNEVNIEALNASEVITDIESFYQTNATLHGLPYEVDKVFAKFIVKLTVDRDELEDNEVVAIRVPHYCKHNVTNVFRLAVPGVNYNDFPWSNYTGARIHRSAGNCYVDLYLRDDGRGDGPYTWDTPGIILSQFAFVHATNTSVGRWADFNEDMTFVKEHNVSSPTTGVRVLDVRKDTTHLTKTRPLGIISVTAEVPHNATAEFVVPYPCHMEVARWVEDEGFGLLPFPWDPATGTGYKLRGRSAHDPNTCEISVFVKDNGRGDSEKYLSGIIVKPGTAELDEPAEWLLMAIIPGIVLGALALFAVIAGVIYWKRKNGYTRVDSVLS